jgi:hypothetical protein
MFGISPVGMMTGMYSPYSMYGYGMNRHQMLNQAYGPGYNLNGKPYAQGYPMPIIDRGNYDLEKEGVVRRFIKKHFT